MNELTIDQRIANLSAAEAAYRTATDAQQVELTAAEVAYNAQREQIISNHKTEIDSALATLEQARIDCAGIQIVSVA